MSSSSVFDPSSSEDCRLCSIVLTVSSRRPFGPLLLWTVLNVPSMPDATHLVQGGISVQRIFLTLQGSHALRASLSRGDRLPGMGRPARRKSWLALEH